MTTLTRSITEEDILKAFRFVHSANTAAGLVGGVYMYGCAEMESTSASDEHEEVVKCTTTTAHPLSRARSSSLVKKLLTPSELSTSPRTYLRAGSTTTQERLGSRYAAAEIPGGIESGRAATGLDRLLLAPLTRKQVAELPTVFS